jgi:serine/threonine protein kinase
MLNNYSLSALHINESISLSNLEISLDLFPKEDINGCLFDAEKKHYATLNYENIMFEGGYGILQLCKRTDVSGYIEQVIVKKPKQTINLGPEAITQWLARTILKNYGLEKSIPEVHDIFASSSQLSFSMEFIHGDFPYVYLAKVKNPDLFFFQILAQVSVLLLILEKEMNLDHRDLKANNLFIREEPIDYTLDISGVSIHIQAPFRVFILDFGFACIGNGHGISQVNIAPGIFSSTDPCPKEGRDIFHLLTSFWSIPTIREKMSASTQAEVDDWLTKDNKNFSRLARKFKQTEWVYVVTSNPEFSYPKLSPMSILKRIGELDL